MSADEPFVPDADEGPADLPDRSCQAQGFLDGRLGLQAHAVGQGTVMTWNGQHSSSFVVHSSCRTHGKGVHVPLGSPCAWRTEAVLLADAETLELDEGPGTLNRRKCCLLTFHRMNR